MAPFCASTAVTLGVHYFPTRSSSVFSAAATVCFGRTPRGSVYRGSFRTGLRVPIGVAGAGVWGRIQGEGVGKSMRKLCRNYPLANYPVVSSKQKGAGEEGAAGYCPEILLPKSAKWVLCSLLRSHREICTRNRPLSEKKFLDDFWAPLPLLAPLFYC